jgi:host factor-I protein
MNTKLLNLQDNFLNQIRKENIPVIIYLANGFQLRGAVKGFDNFTVILENDGKHQLVYKHAISTITPIRPLQALFTEKRDEPVSQ